MTKSRGISRRGALQLGAATAALPLVHIRTAGAAGRVSIAFWDHWVPGGNNVMQKQVDAWAEKNKVDVHVDFVTSVGKKLILTAAAEAQAKAGHDVMAFFTWDVHNHADVAGEPRCGDQAADRQIRRDERDRQLPRQDQGPMEGGSDQFRRADQAALRAHQLVQEARPGRAGDVPSEAGTHRDAG